MDSKQFSELLVSKRLEAGVSIDEMSERMQVTRYVVQDIELGVYNSNMKKTMNYIASLGLLLVIIDKRNCECQAFSTYEELAKWCASQWPRYYHFNKGRLDANGVRHFSISGRGVNPDGIIRQKLLELCYAAILDVEIMDEQQLSQLKNELSDKRNSTPIALVVCFPLGLLAAVAAVIGWCVAIYKIGCWIGSCSNLCGGDPALYFMSILLLAIGLGFMFFLLPKGIIPVYTYSLIFSTIVFSSLFEITSKFIKRQFEITSKFIKRQFEITSKFIKRL